MKYGVLGDIHANLCALTVVLQHMREEGVDIILSVGDVVGYGAAPRECIELIRSHNVVTVKGNHDAACVGELDERQFNPYAREAVLWTREALGRTEMDWLRSLPLTAELEHCHLSHGTLYRPELFDYVLSTTDADASLDIMTRLVCFVGHSHIPLTLMRFADVPDRTAYSQDSEIDLADVSCALINVGSVGQPRDEEPRSAYAIYDSEARQAWIKRCSYDIDREAHRIRTAGLPEVLAERLRLGI
jgi:predicted phosphodiesterase